MGCDGIRCGGRMSCGDCQYTYGPVASAFIAVPDNFNSVTNFVPKYPVYRSLRVEQKAVENTAFSNKCCDTNRDASDYSTGCNGNDMGFIMYPHRIRPVQVTVCGNAACVCDTKASNGDLFTGGCCNKAPCAELESHGFVAWPPIGYFKDVKACGAIDTKVCCKKHKRPDCRKCRVVAGCKRRCKGEKSSDCGCH